MSLDEMKGGNEPPACKRGGRAGADHAGGELVKTHKLADVCHGGAGELIKRCDLFVVEGDDGGGFAEAV